ncbi:MAG: triple tyrosine motif-containing protein, partial [Halioglobus sp.]
NRNTATYTNLPAGEYTLRVQGANSAGIWNRDGINLRIHVLPPPWLSWWAYGLYSAALGLLIWGLHRIYRSYAIDKNSNELANEMFEAESRADDELQEQFEIQEEIIASAYDHNQTTLSLLGDCISVRSSNHTEEPGRKLAKISVRRISALSRLEDCLYYQAGGPRVDLNKFTDSIISDLLAASTTKPETVISINEVTSTLIPADLASRLAIIIVELVENCLFHAFAADSPVNYIHITMTPRTSFQPFAHYLELTVRDSGVGLPDDFDESVFEDSGIAIVHSIIESLGGEIEFSRVPGTLISMVIPNPDAW